MGHVLERRRRKHENEIETQRFPVDPAEIRDFGGDFGAENPERDTVAQFQAHRIGKILIDGNLALGRIGGPPGAFRHRIGLRQVTGVGKAALASQRPGALRHVLHVRNPGHRARRSIGQDRAAHHRDEADIGTRIRCLDQIREPG